MNKLRPLFNSLMFKLFLAVFLIIGPIVIVLIINSYYSVSVIRNQVAESNKNLLNIYIGEIDRNLEVIEKYIFQLSEDEVDLAHFQSNGTHDYNEFIQAKLRLYNEISNNSNFYTTVDSVFIYTSAHDDMINTQDFGSNYIERQTAKQEILRYFQTKPDPLPYGQWIIIEGDQNHYLLHYYKNDDVYIGAWVDVDEVVNPFKHLDFGESGRALVADSSLQPLTSKSFIEEESLDLSSDDNMFVVSGKEEKFIVMKEPSLKGDFYLIALIPESEVLEELSFLQKISSVFSVIAIIFLLFFIFIMRKIFLTPINHLVLAMKKLRKGNLEFRLPEEQKSTEFKVLNETFNHMISEIKDLKINIYEEKLNHQRAELKHLQLQINPHFFLNSLNIIYNLATVKDFVVIQQMSKALANYFRFMFKSNPYFVRLKDELEHTENYLKIQQLRFPDSFFYTIRTPNELADCKIPPLMIQTLAENSIKHALNLDNPIEISILVEEREPGYMLIEVQDSGEGFPEEVLTCLEKNEQLTTEDGEHIGIWNIKRRLDLLYTDNTSITFTNDHGKGATIRIRLPIEEL